MAAVPVIAADPVPVKVEIPFAATVIKEGGRYLIQVPARPGQIYCLEVPDGSGGMTFAGVPGTAIYAQSDKVRWPLELAGTVVGAEEDGNSAGASAGASPPAAGGTVLLPLTIEVSESQGTHVRLLVGGANPWVAVAEVAFPRVTFEGFADLPTATGVRCTALSTRVVTAPIGATEPGKAGLTLEQQQEFDAVLAGLPQLIAAATLPPGATPALGTTGTSPLAAARFFRVAMYVVDSNGNGFADADELAGGKNPFARPDETGYVDASGAGVNGVGGMSPIWDRDEDFSPDFEEIAAETSMFEKRYAPVVLTCQTFDRRADFDSSGSWRELEKRVVGWERHWDGFNEEMLSWAPVSPDVGTTPRTLAGFMSDFADGWENPLPESGKGLPPRSLFEEYFMLPALIARRVRPAAGVAGNPEATSGYIRAIGARYRLRGPLSLEDQHRQFLKVTWTQTSGFEQGHDLEYAAWSLMGQPLLEQEPTSVEVVTLTIPRGSLYSDPPHDVVPQYSVPNGPANPEMPHSQVGEYLKVVRLLPIELRDIKDLANTRDDVTITNWTSGQEISDANVAWIEAHKSATDDAPRMPQLFFNVPGLPQNFTMDAKLLVEYERPYAGKQTDDTVRIPTNGSFKSVTNGRWEIWNEYANLPFFGGDATLTYKINGGAEQTIKFAIGGRNPDDVRCKTYTQGRPNAPWYAYAIEKHESQNYNPGYYNQFWERRGSSSPINNGVNYNFTKGDALIVRSPGETGVGGTGLAQVTGAGGNKTVSAPREIFWNWQRNVDAFLGIMSSKIQIAEAFMNDPTPRNGPGSMPNGQRPQTTFHTGHNVAVPSNVQGRVAFGDTQGNKAPEDAVAIKAYNGASAHWCSWRGPTVHAWQFNYGQNNYVEEVCNEIEGAQP